MTLPGRLIVLEGPDGAGKTTLAVALVERLRSVGEIARYISFPGREPRTLGKHVYQLQHDIRAAGLDRLDPTSLQLLHIAAHVDAIESQLLPTLALGETVVLDRFWWSTWAYGITSGANARSLELMLAIEEQHWRDVVPDVIFLILNRAVEAESSLNPVLAEYKQLASRVGPPVHIVTNDGTVSQALNAILNAIPLRAHAKPHSND
jgi:thymidylate kinase